MTTVTDSLAPTQAEQYAISRIEQATRMLAEVESAPEVKDIRDKAEAIRLYLRQQAGSLRSQNHAAALKLRAERKLGEMLAETVRHEGGKPLQGATVTSDFGIERTASHRWQTIARLPEPEFEAYVGQADTTERELTSAELYRIAKVTFRDSQRAEFAEKAEAIENTPVSEAHPATHGEWWQLGRHLLYCGDTSGPEFRQRLPERAALAFADPPYNVGKAGWDSGFVWAHDYLADCADIVLVTPGISSIFDFARKTAMPYRWSLAAWIDNGMVGGPVGFANWIYVALFSRVESVHRNTQDHLRVTINNRETPDTAHPSRKPSSLMTQLVATYSEEGDTVIDPFAGSGSTLFACEAAGRACITGEIEPEYCGEIIARWEAATGGKAVRL